MSDKKEMEVLQEKLEKTNQCVKNLKSESINLKKAIWDIMNYANMYVMLLDSKMIIRLANWSLATDLGFKEEKELVGHCFLDFIIQQEKEFISKAHHELAFNHEKEKYKELTINIQSIDKKIITGKWFNTLVNSGYNMTFSMGVKNTPLETTSVSEDYVRSYYRDIIQKDRTMIQSLKDVVITDINKEIL